MWMPIFHAGKMLLLDSRLTCLEIQLESLSHLPFIAVPLLLSAPHSRRMLRTATFSFEPCMCQPGQERSTWPEESSAGLLGSEEELGKSVEPGGPGGNEHLEPTERSGDLSDAWPSSATFRPTFFSCLINKQWECSMFIYLFIFLSLH